MSDSTISIAQEIQQDREKGAARLVAEYKERLYAAAFSLCGDATEAEDLVFRTFEQVLDKIDSYLKSQTATGIDKLHYEELLRQTKLIRDKRIEP